MTAGTITSAGILALAQQMVGIGTVPAWTYIALDSDATAENVAHTGPQAEITTNGGARAAGTPSTESDTKSVLTKEFTFTGALAINALCWMNASSVGTMLSRSKLDATRNVINGDTVTVVLKMTHSQTA